MLKRLNASLRGILLALWGEESKASKKGGCYLTRYSRRRRVQSRAGMEVQVKRPGARVKHPEDAYQRGTT